MKVTPTPDQKAFIRQAIETGRIARPEDAAAEAMALWEERERRRAEILAHVDLAETSLARDEGIEITKESMKALADDVKRRGRARLAAESSTRR
jgi:Arc/MetJ-type ribon-helix-helix transcriptional regulator